MDDAEKIAHLRAALEIYANPAHWRIASKNMGHGDSINAVTWVGPPDASQFDYGPHKGPEYAARALKILEG